MQRIHKMLVRLAIVVGLVSFASVALAADPGSIELQAKAEKVVVEVTADGTEKTSYVAPEVVVPGDRIAYTISAKNVSAKDVEQVVITDPIPAEMTFLTGTETREAGRVLFSVDGGRRFDAAEKLVVLEDGQSRPAESSDFTHIRWVFDAPLAPEAERAVRFVAQVD